MKQSISAIFPEFYDKRQTASAAAYVAHIDPELLRDGTYFVLESGPELVACGGWSRRDRLYTGSGSSANDGRDLDPEIEPARIRAMFVRPDWTRRGLGRRILDESERAAADEGFRKLALLATLPGVLLYQAFGFEPTGPPRDVVLEDGVALACVPMERPIRASSNEFIRSAQHATPAST
jgi:GNAT superfamily N-acetyltransferase